MAKKTLTQTNAYIDIKVYENDDNEVTATMANEVYKAIAESSIPSHNLDPGAVTWEPTQQLLSPTTLTGASDSLASIQTFDVNTGATIFVKIANKIYHYELKASTEAEESPNYIRPNDYEAVANEKVWCLLSERVKTFTTSDLTDGVLTYEHNLDYAGGFFIQLKDPNGIFQPISQQITATDDNTIEIDFGGAIDAGTWTLILKI